MYLVDRVYMEICHPARYNGWLADIRILDDGYRLMGLYPKDILLTFAEDRFSIDEEWDDPWAYVEIKEVLADELHAPIKVGDYAYSVRAGHPFEWREDEEEEGEGDYPLREGVLRGRYLVEVGSRPFRGWLVDVIIGDGCSYIGQEKDLVLVRGVFPQGVLRPPKEDGFYFTDWDYHLIDALSDILDANVKVTGVCYQFRKGHPFERVVEGS
jgi:hypothetical protein